MTRARRLCLLVLPLGLLAGCAGQLRDYVGSRAAPLRPQLIRYGFSLPEMACVGERLGQALHPRQLRFLVRATTQIERPYYNPDRFSPRDFVWASGAVADRSVQPEVSRALEACNVQVAPQAIVVPPPVVAGPPAPRPPVWLNLGAAPSGQAIAVDGASLEQEEDARIAWFRMIDPPPAGLNPNVYRLRIDCRTRIIRPLGHRLYDAAGTILQERAYTEAEQLTSPVEGGTVTEIAYLSLCT